MQVANNVWLLAVISIPLTLFTLLLWWGWVAYTKVPAEHFGNEHTIIIEDSTYSRMTRKDSNLKKLIAAARGKMAIRDEEVGQSPTSPCAPTRSATSKTDASTLKEG